MTDQKSVFIHIISFFDSFIIVHPVNVQIQWGGSLIYDAKNSIYIYIYRHRFSISIGNTKNQTFFLEWHAVKICLHFHYRLICNVLVIICTWRIEKWELQILSWSSPIQPEIAPLFTIPFQCLKKRFSKVGGSVIGWRSGLSCRDI